MRRYHCNKLIEHKQMFHLGIAIILSHFAECHYTEGSVRIYADCCYAERNHADNCIALCHYTFDC
jgi:hypothetical protein